VIRDIASALNRLLRDPGLRTSMGVAAARRASQIYSWDRLGEEMRDHYESVLDDPVLRAKQHDNLTLNIF
jgi:starch synthase